MLLRTKNKAVSHDLDLAALNSYAYCPTLTTTST